MSLRLLWLRMPTVVSIKFEQAPRNLIQKVHVFIKTSLYFLYILRERTERRERSAKHSEDLASKVLHPSFTVSIHSVFLSSYFFLFPVLSFLLSFCFSHGFSGDFLLSMESCRLLQRTLVVYGDFRVFLAIFGRLGNY